MARGDMCGHNFKYKSTLRRAGRHQSIRPRTNSECGAFNHSATSPSAQNSRCAVMYPRRKS